MAWGELQLHSLCYKLIVSYLLGKYLYIFVERNGRTHISTNGAGFSRCTCRQFTLLEDERQQREQGMPGDRNECCTVKVAST